MPPRTAEAPPRPFVEQPPADYGPSAVDPNRVQHQQMFEDRAMALQAFQGMPPEELAARQARLKSFGRAAPVAAGVMREGHANMPVEQLAQEAAKIEYYQHRGPLVSEALLDTLLDSINREAVVANRLATMRGGRPLTAAEAQANDTETWDRVMSNFEQAKAEELERLPDTPLLSFPAMEEEHNEPEPASPLQLSPPPSSPPIPPDRHSSTADFKRYRGRLYPGDVPRPADWPKPRTRGGRSNTADFRRGPENMDLFNLNAPDASEAPTAELNVVPLPPTQEMEIPYAFPNEKHIYYEASSAPKESVQEFVSGNYDVPKQLVTIVAQPGAELDMDRHPHTRDLDGRQIIVTYADDNQDFISGRMELDLQDIYRNGLAEGQNFRSIGNLGVLRIGEQRLRADGTLTDSIIKRVEFVSGTATAKSDLGDYVKRIGQNPFAKNDARLRAAFGAINNRARRAAEEQPTEEHTTNRSPRPEADSSRLGDLKDFFKEWRAGYDQVWQSIFDTIFRRAASTSGDANDGPAVDWEAPQEPVPMREEPNPYNVLGVDKSASDSEIKKVFRRMANTNHPDIGGDEEKFKDISAAYDVLGRPAQRAYYDEHGTMEGYDDSTQ